MELEIWVLDLTLEFTGCVISDRPLNPAGPRLPHVLNVEHNATYLPGLGGGLDEKYFENGRVPKQNVSLYYASIKNGLAF